MYVINNEVLHVVRRYPGRVTGNGQDTVRQLLVSLNAEPLRQPAAGRRKKIALNREALDLLQAQGFTPESIIGDGHIVMLRRTPNISTGGEAEDVPLTDIHQDNLALFIRTARLLNLDIAGIDFLSTDISKSWLDNNALICEVNAQPLAEGSVDLILLDTGLCLLIWPQQQTRVVHEIARVLRPGGRCCIRLLVLPDQPQTPADLFAAIRQGQIPDLGSLRIHLWMALQASTGRAVSNQDIWGGLKQEFGTWAELAKAIKCDASYMEAFAETRITQAWPVFEFASEADYAEVFRKPEFALSIESVFRPGYTLGERCPTYVLRKSEVKTATCWWIIHFHLTRLPCLAS